MQASTLFLLVLGMSVYGFAAGQNMARSHARQLGGSYRLPSLPSYYGAQTALMAGLPALLFLLLWLLFEQSLLRQLVMARANLPLVVESDSGLAFSKITNMANGLLPLTEQPRGYVDAADHFSRLQQQGRWVRNIATLVVASVGLTWGLRRVRLRFPARQRVEKMLDILLLLSAMVAILTTVGILLSVVFESLRFFQQVPLTEFVFGSNWSPQLAIRPGQVGASGSFGAVPLFLGTMLITLLAMLVAVPVGLMSAIYLAEYARQGTRDWAKPSLEILAGIPTVVYGFFAALTVAPLIRHWGQNLGLSVSSESALAAGAVMGLMIVPFISSLACDVIRAVPQSLRDASYALGATQSETIVKVVLPAALPGIVGGLLLAVSRAIGETMIVLMAAGLAANVSFNPLDSVTTVTVQIVTLLTGDQAFDSPKTLAAFALGLMLFISTLFLNLLALRVVKRYRERYE